MPQRSAGILVYRRREGCLEVLLVHPGGPFFRNKDAGIWTLPKGLVEDGESASDTAKREFEEETGLALPAGPLLPLGDVQQKGGKRVEAWAVEGDLDLAHFASNMFEIEWPPRSGSRQRFPEADRADYFGLAAAREKLNPAQVQFLERLDEVLRDGSPPP